MRKNILYQIYLKSFSCALLIFSVHLLIANTSTNLSAETTAMPYGWIEEQIDWTDAAHIWNQEKAIRLAEKGRLTSTFATDIWGPFGAHLPASPALRSDCDNVIDPGTIGYNQEFCEPNSDPDEIVSLSLPGGGSGELEYIWLRKIGNGEWETIPGSTSPSYDPGPLSTPTFFRRCVRRAGCEEYIETDIVHITFLIPSLLEVSKSCVEDESGKYQVDLATSNVNVVTANGERIYAPYVITANAGEVIEVVATGDCGTIERSIDDSGVDYTACENPCIAPEITIKGTPVCNPDNESYSVDFTVTDADSVFVNGTLQAGTGPDFSVDVPEGQNASIRAVNECDSDNRSVESPTCQLPCPVTITIPTAGNPVCNDDNDTYTVTFTVEGADSVFVNEVFYTPTSGNTYTLTFPRGVRTCIFAWKYNEDGSPLCRANREVDAPPCCDDPSPSIPAIVTECNDDNTTYTLTATVLDADEVRVNGELVAPEASDSTKYVVVLEVGVKAEIEAITECDGQKLRAFRSAESPVCNCPKPEIEITEQICDDDDQNYTISFTVTGADSVYLNGELLAGTGPDFSGSLPTGENAMIKAIKDCGDVKAEATATAPAPCCLPTPTIVINEKFCSPDSTDFTLTFTVTDADEVFVNDVLQTEVGPQYTVTLPASDTARILVKNECAQASRQEVAICCPIPEIGISFDDNPSCNPDGETYTLNFTVTGAVSVSVNEVELEDDGPDYSITFPNGTRACIMATADCGNRATREVEAPTECPPTCPTPTVSITVDSTNPACNPGDTTYNITFTVSNMPDSVFVNGDLVASEDPTFSVDVSIDQQAVIRAVKICGELSAEDTKTIDPPTCPPTCPTPTVSITVDSANPACNPGDTTYNITFTVSNMPDSVFVNGDLVASEDSTFSVDVSIDQQAVIRAVKICGELSAEDTKTIDPPTCPPCPIPTVSITVDSANPACNPGDTTYNITFTVSNMPDSVFVNGDLVTSEDSTFSVDVSIDQQAVIRAVKICGELSAEDTKTIDPPTCPPTCPTPTVSITVDSANPACNPGDTTYNITFTVSNMPDSVFVNGDLVASEDSTFSVDVSIDQQAVIRAVKICGELSAEDTKTIDPPTCPPCPTPTVSITVDSANPACNPGDTTYNITFTVSNMPDSVFVNGDLVTSEDSTFSVDVSIDQKAVIRAVKICGELSAEDTKTIDPPTCPPCPIPTVSITVDSANPACNPGDTTYNITFTVSNMPDSVFVNGDLVTSEDSTFSVDVSIDQQAVIRAVKICGELSAEDTKTIDPPTCPPCPIPTVSITVDSANPACNPGDTTYNITFTVSNMPDSVFVNGDLVTSEDSTFSVDVSIDQQAVIRAVKICGELSAEDTKTIDPPTCPPCPIPTVSITVDSANPACNPGDTTYNITFTVSNMPDSVFVNGDLVTSEDSTFSVDVSIDQQAVIRAVKICGELSAEDTKTIDPPTCPPCPIPTVSITVDSANPACNPGDTTYNITFTVSNMPDSVFVNGDLVTSEDSTFSVDVSIDQQAVIRAVKICGELSAEDTKTIDPPTCPPCPIPTVSITVDSANPACNPGDTTYNITFTVSNMPDSVFVNGDLVTSEDSTFSVDVSIDQQAVIRAVKICGELSAEDTKTIDPPTCPPCPIPTVSITVDSANPACNPGDTTYNITFTVSNMPDSVFVNGDLVTSEDSTFSVDVSIDQQAVIRAVKICGELSAEDTKTIDPPTCPPCPIPTVSITVDSANPACNPGDTTYNITFTVSNMPDSVFVNGDLVTSEDSTFSVDVSIDQQAVIRAVKICGELSAEDTKTIDPPTCPPCPIPTVSITVDSANPACNPGDTTYNITFTVSNMPDSVFVNGDLVTSEDSTFSVDVSIDQQAVIRAVKICGELSAEDTKTIDPPTCPPCPIPTVSITVDSANPACNPGDTTYNITFTVSNMPDSVFVNGDLVASEDSTFSVDVSIDQQAVIRAVKICGELSAEDTKTIDPPTCPPCPIPTVSIMVDSANPACNPGDTTYNITFSVSNMPDSVFVNGDLVTSEDSTFSVDVSIDQQAVIRAVKICGELSAEDTKTIDPPTCPPPCPTPTVSIMVDSANPACNPGDTTYNITFSVSNMPDSVFVNGDLVTSEDSTFSVDVSIDQQAVIRAVKICGELSAEDTKTIDPPTCPPPCPTPTVSITVDSANPACNPGDTTYNITFTVSNMPDSVFVNGDLVTSEDSTFSVDVSIDQQAVIRAVKICGELSAEDTKTIDPPTCPPCPIPTVSITVDSANPACNPGDTTYNITFTVSNMPDSVFVNGDLVTSEDSTFSVDVSIDQQAVIRAVKICGELSAEDTKTIDPPTCPPCPIPTVSITVDSANPACNPGDTTYNITFTVSNMPDSVFVNGDLVTSEDSTFSVDVSIDQQAVIRAVKICGELSAEDTKTIDPPTCPPCPIPTVSITVDSANPACNPGDTTYNITFTVSNMPDSVFVNGDLVTSEDSTFSVDVSIDQQAVIRAVKICGELSAEDTKTIDPPTCPPCPIPTVSITVDSANPACNPGDTTYNITFTVSNMPDSVFVNGDLVTSEDSTFSVDVSIDQQAVIRAVKICGELSAEDTKTIDPPTCPECTLEVGITTAASTVCPERELCTILTAIAAEGQPAYQYSWTDEQGTVLGTADTLEVCLPGTYFIEVMDQDSCMATDSIAIIEDCPVCDMTVEIVPSDASLTDCDQVLTADIQGGTAPFTYSWTKDGQPFGDNTESITVTGMAGNYVLTVIDDEHCEAVSTITITPCCPSQATVRESLFLPNAFSPNNDGVNDDLRFVIQNSETGNPLADLDATVYIFNRWGEKLKTFNSFKDTWDGTFRGKILPPDVYGYYFIIRCSTSGEVVLEEKGNITILK